MKKILAFATSLTFFFIFIMCSKSKKESLVNPGSSPIKVSADQGGSVVETGKRVYDIYCLMCHGEDGTKELTGDYDLAISKLQLKDIMDVIGEGRSTMIGYEVILNEEEIRAVSEYTLKLKN